MDKVLNSESESFFNALDVEISSKKLVHNSATDHEVSSEKLVHNYNSATDHEVSSKKLFLSSGINTVGKQQPTRTLFFNSVEFTRAVGVESSFFNTVEFTSTVGVESTFFNSVEFTRTVGDERSSDAECKTTRVFPLSLTTTLQCLGLLFASSFLPPPPSCLLSK